VAWSFGFTYLWLVESIELSRLMNLISLWLESIDFSRVRNLIGLVAISLQVFIGLDTTEFFFK